MNTIKVEIPEVHIKYLREYYQKQIEERKDKVAFIQNEVNDFNSFLSQLPELSENGKTDTGEHLSRIELRKNGYNPRWSLIQKIFFVIENKNTALTARQITDILVSEFEPRLEKDKKRLYGSISGTLSNNSKENGKFTRTKNELDELIYEVTKKEEKI